VYGATELVLRALMIIFTFIPMIIIAVTTVWLVKYLKSVRDVSRETVVTLLAVSTVFIISYLPMFMYIVVLLLIDYTPTLYVNVFMYLRRFVDLIMYINYTANPLIYYITVKSFTVFVDELINRMKRRSNAVAAEPPIPLQVIANSPAQ
jgi:hypothetical protein